MALMEHAEAQLAEIELLMSMFPGEEELQVDQVALSELRDFVEGTSGNPPITRVEVCVRIRTHTGVCVTLSCSYPPEYPQVPPEVTVRCGELSRTRLSALLSTLRSYLSQSCGGEACVLSAVTWLRDHTDEHTGGRESHAPTDEPQTPRGETFTRLWIYSHHIYNRSKRKSILEWAKELQLSGFCMPGKPGLVCVEGRSRSCEEFWARVKVLTWQRIMIRHREDTPLDPTNQSAEGQRRFHGFEEMVFGPHGSRGNHMDLGQLFQFLSERGCGEIFQLYFGVEGR